MTSPWSVLIVGLGAVAQTHVNALAHREDAVVIAGVDPETVRSPWVAHTPFPIYPDLAIAAERHSPELVVVSTPTSTHAAVAAEAMRRFPAARILVEKPVADRLGDALELLSERDGRPPVEVAFHMAFSPEVLWGEAQVQSYGHLLGPITAVQAWFTDPYASDRAGAHERFGSSWLDSGINALSVLNRFGEPVERRSLNVVGEPSESTYEARISCRSVQDEFEATILTSWHVSDAGRRTVLRFAGGAELMMDHHAVAGYLMESGRVREVFGSDGTVPRRESHYRGLYDQLIGRGQPVIEPARSRRLHELLLLDLDSAIGGPPGR